MPTSGMTYGINQGPFGPSTYTRMGLIQDRRLRRDLVEGQITKFPPPECWIWFPRSTPMPVLDLDHHSLTIVRPPDDTSSFETIGTRKQLFLMHLRRLSVSETAEIQWLAKPAEWSFWELWKEEQAGQFNPRSQSPDVRWNQLPPGTSLHSCRASQDGQKHRRQSIHHCQ